MDVEPEDDEHIENVKRVGKLKIKEAFKREEVSGGFCNSTKIVYLIKI